MKKCRTCQTEKLETEFTTHSKSPHTLRLDCNSCRSAAWTASNKDPKRKEQRTRASKNCKLLKAYGITLENYEQMLRAQDNKCGIWQLDASQMKGRLHLNHNKKTKAIRSVQCGRCNVGVGQLD